MSAMSSFRRKAIRSIAKKNGWKVCGGWRQESGKQRVGGTSLNDSIRKLVKHVNKGGE